MKIICIGRNYAAHAAELGNDVPDEPLFFLKPETAILPDGEPFRFPSYSSDIHYELELVVRIGRQGKNIPSESVAQYMADFTIGLDMTARDVQSELKANGKPWEKAKSFDGSAILGNSFLPWSSYNPETTRFSMALNGSTVQIGDPRLMLFPIPELVAHVSQCMTLMPGDLIFTGTPKGVGPVSHGDQMVGILAGRRLIDVAVE
jgi:2-keto-4-pentenoate hydratase/2-oxohepta-3-ene-1,7-dioic acid hydratase in catechol pathway